MKNKQVSAKLRVISGRLRGSKINIVDTDQMQPTSDRVRETLFNWLQPNIYESSCLDLFAGSGILGIEAISRGASKVISVEDNEVHLKSLKENIKRLQIENLEIIKSDSLEWLKSSKNTFDIIFIDPPYKSSLYEPIIEEIINKKIIKNNGVIYIESSLPLEIFLKNKNLNLLKSSKAGITNFGLFSINHSIN